MLYVVMIFQRVGGGGVVCDDYSVCRKKSV